MMLRFIPCLFVLLAFGLAAQENPRVRFVRASGDATLSVKPDRAEVTIGVASRAPSAQEASSKNADESARLFSAIKQVLGSGGEIKTSGYSLSPQYDYSNGHAPRLTGYEASNAVNVMVDELSLLGKVIDAATGAGATNINGISFTVRDSTALREKVLSEAAVHARANAEALAKALGVTVVGLLEAEPAEAPVIRPLVRALPMAMAAQAQPATPIEAGDVDIRATVTVKLEVR